MSSGLFKKIAESRWFQQVVIFFIILAGLIVGLETYHRQISHWMTILQALDYLILIIFTVEAAVKILAEGDQPGRYFKDPWNLFDFLIVVVCWLPFLFPFLDTGFVAVFRLARILRVLRLVSALPQLRLLVDALLKSIPGMGYVGVLLLLLFYIYGAIGVFLFGENDPVHFSNLHTSLLSLFTIVTLEGWADIMYVNVFGCDDLIYGTENCPYPKSNLIGGVIYFVSFVLLGTMIILNLFIGVIMNSMDEVRQEQALEAQELRRVEGNVIPEDDIYRLKMKLEEVKDQLDILALRLKKNRDNNEGI